MQEAPVFWPARPYVWTNHLWIISTLDAGYSLISCNINGRRTLQDLHLQLRSLLYLCANQSYRWCLITHTCCIGIIHSRHCCDSCIFLISQHLSFEFIHIFSCVIPALLQTDLCWRKQIRLADNKTVFNVLYVTSYTPLRPFTICFIVVSFRRCFQIRRYFAVHSVWDQYLHQENIQSVPPSIAGILKCFTPVSGASTKLKVYLNSCLLYYKHPLLPQSCLSCGSVASHW